VEDVDRKTRVEEITTGCVAESGQDGVVIDPATVAVLPPLWSMCRALPAAHIAINIFVD